MLLGVGAICLAVGLALLGYNLLARERKPRGIAGALTSIDRHYGQHSAGATRQAGDAPPKLPEWTKTLAIKLSPKGFGATLQRRLDIAGNPARFTAERILALKGIGLVIGAFFGIVAGIHSLGLAVVYGAVAGAIGFFLPDVLLYNSGAKRQVKILNALPDGIDMLTVCAEAGLGFDAAMAQVARNTTGPLAEEFARALQEMQIGLSRSDALRATADRTTVVELRAFVSSIVQANDLGIPVARVLREQAREMRVRRRQRAEERAQKVPVKIMFPLIACMFPALLVIILGPGVIHIARALFGA